MNCFFYATQTLKLLTSETSSSCNSCIIASDSQIKLTGYRFVVTRAVRFIGRTDARNSKTERGGGYGAGRRLDGKASENLFPYS